MALKARHQRELDAMAEALIRINNEMEKELKQKIDIVSHKIKIELTEND